MKWPIFFYLAFSVSPGILWQWFCSTVLLIWNHFLLTVDLFTHLVSLHPQASVNEAQHVLASQSVEHANPDSLVIVLGDFNKGNLTQKLPKYRQFIKCPTREGNTLDHCYSTISKAPEQHWVTQTMPWSTWFLHTGRSLSAVSLLWGHQNSGIVTYALL